MKLEFPNLEGLMVIRVYLVDDHEVVRRGLRDLLEAEGDIVVIGESASALQSMRRIPAARPDVMILDVRLADGNGISVCRDVRSVDPSIQALILTSYEDDEAFLSAVIAGAKGYLLKQVRSTSLVRSVRAIAAGENLLDPAVTRKIRDRMQKGASRPAELAPLTVQELRVFDLIAVGQTNKEIAGHVGLAEKTVKNYVSRILGKLGLESRTQAAILASRLTRDTHR